MPRGHRGVTLIEMLIVITMVGLMAAIMVPKLRPSATTKVRQAADQLVRDLELARTRALSTRSAVRVVFTAGSSSYAGYLDWNRDSVFAISAAESDSLRGFGTRVLAEQVAYGRGSAPDLPTVPGGGSITFAGAAVTFDARGLTTPFGSRGVVYMTHPTDAAAIAAVSVTAGGAVRRWVYLGGNWQ